MPINRHEGYQIFHQNVRLDHMRSVQLRSIKPSGHRSHEPLNSKHCSERRTGPAHHELPHHIDRRGTT